MWCAWVRLPLARLRWATLAQVTDSTMPLVSVNWASGVTVRLRCRRCASRRSALGLDEEGGDPGAVFQLEPVTGVVTGDYLDLLAS